MRKTIIVVGFLSLVGVANSYASDSDRIDQLEARVSRLEALLSAPSAAEKFVPSGEGWRSITNWRKLDGGMSPRDVRSILGEPQRLDGGAMATWTYPNGGYINFMHGKLWKWTEPRE